MTFNFTMSKQLLKWACKMAYKEWKHYEDNPMDGRRYNHNSLAGCYVGRKSEVAVFGLFKKKLPNADVRSEFTKPGHEADILVDHHLIEVKGLQEKQWKEFKRMIPPKQLKKYAAKDAIVVWTTTEGDKETALVKIRGWNYAKDLVEKGEEVITICDNIWLKDDKDMRSIKDLLQMLDISPMDALKQWSEQNK